MQHTRVRHWTPKPVIICSIRSSPTGGNFFFAVVKFFEYKIAISANFVQTMKNSTMGMDFWIFCVHYILVSYPKQGYSFQNLLQSVLSDVVSVDGSQDKILFWGIRSFRQTWGGRSEWGRGP